MAHSPNGENMKKNILIIEDDIYIHASLKELLEEEGFAVSSASNGEEGIRKLQNGEQPDLILLDLMMPVKDGFQFREEQMSNPAYREFPVVAMSAYGNLHTNKEKLSVEAYLKKPIDIDNLLATIRQWCR